MDRWIARMRMPLMLALVALVAAGCSGKTIAPQRVDATTYDIRAHGTCDTGEWCAYYFQIYDYTNKSWSATPVRGAYWGNGQKQILPERIRVASRAWVAYRICGAVAKPGGQWSDWACAGPSGDANASDWQWFRAS